jgi:hypothetical protein
VPELPVDCPETDDPVCSCDGSEFRNACLAGPRGIDPACSVSPSTYDPCANAVCGDGCRLCSPDDVDCAETLEPKYCTTDGRCIDTDPECPATPSDACTAQDATSSGDDCLQLEGYAFDGTACSPIFCGCVGEECDALYPSQGLCELALGECIEPGRTCTDDVFPLVDGDPIWSPAYPEFTFEVTVHPNLVDGEEEIAVLEEWTAARWLGANDLVTDPAECPVVGASEVTLCPYPRELSLDVDGEFVSLLAVLKWDQVVLPDVDAEVEVRIENHPRGSSSFRVREPATMLPLLMIVQRGASLEVEESWEFSPFTFRPGPTLCEARSADCNWVFLAQSLEVEIDGQPRPSRVDPLEVGILPETSAGAAYQVSHSALFVQTFEADEPCAALYPPRQSFALSRFAD